MCRDGQKAVLAEHTTDDRELLRLKRWRTRTQRSHYREGEADHPVPVAETGAVPEGPFYLPFAKTPNLSAYLNPHLLGSKSDALGACRSQLPRNRMSELFTSGSVGGMGR